MDAPNRYRAEVAPGGTENAERAALQPNPPGHEFKTQEADAYRTLPLAIVAMTDGRCGSLGSTRIRSARRPTSIVPRSSSAAALAGRSETNAQARSSGTMSSAARRNAAISGAG